MRRRCIFKTKADRQIVQSPERLLWMPLPSLRLQDEVDPQLGFILKRMELCDNVKDLRAFLREIETIAMDLPSSKARIQYQQSCCCVGLTSSVAEAINKVRETKLDLFSEQMDSYVNSVLELFHFVVDEDEGMGVARS